MRCETQSCFGKSPLYEVVKPVVVVVIALAILAALTFTISKLIPIGGVTLRDKIVTGINTPLGATLTTLAVASPIMCSIGWALAMKKNYKVGRERDSLALQYTEVINKQDDQASTITRYKEMVTSLHEGLMERGREIQELRQEIWDLKLKCKEKEAH